MYRDIPTNDDFFSGASSERLLGENSHDDGQDSTIITDVLDSSVQSPWMVAFVSQMWQAIHKKCSGTCVRMSTARQHSTNGGAERQNAVIEEIMAMSLNNS